ncbi:hypothetical protein, partial [Rhizobium sullae]|uniref:hypothetical protein n=1 Tax=Rhizobium sullae TaxID=50338 RepID=UPI001AECD95B
CCQEDAFPTAPYHHPKERVCGASVINLPLRVIVVGASLDWWHKTGTPFHDRDRGFCADTRYQILFTICLVSRRPRGSNYARAAVQEEVVQGGWEGTA